MTWWLEREPPAPIGVHSCSIRGCPCRVVADRTQVSPPTPVALHRSRLARDGGSGGAYGARAQSLTTATRGAVPSIWKVAHPHPSGYGCRPSAESAAMRNAAAMNERLSFGMTAFFLNRWIFAVSVSFSSATLI